VDAIVDVPLVQALAASAAGTVTAEQRRVMAAWFAETANAVADDPQDSAAVASLTGFVEAWNGDAGVMSAVFLTVGGAGTARLLTALGYSRLHGADQRNAEVVASAAAIRAGLATGSSAWTPAVARTFAAGMVSLATTRSDVRSVIGYLFADSSGARMGESFTVAMADQLDAVERGRGQAWRDGPSSVGQGLTDPGAITSGLAVHDPAAHVLATLGAYPQAGRDWLTQTGLDWADPKVGFDRSRIAYWFGERDWSAATSDGFGGIGALWVGVQAVAGDASAQRQAAAINGSVFGSLVSNPGFLTENVSAQGSAQLAQAVSLQLPALVEVGALRDPVPGVGAWELVETPVASAGVLAASVRQEALAIVLAGATSQAEGRAIIQESLLAYESEILLAASGGHASVDQVLDRLAGVWGVADGAITGATEAELQRASDQVRDALGLVRVPVDTALAFVPNPIVAIGLDAAADYLEKLAMAELTPDGAVPELVAGRNGTEMSDYFTDVVRVYGEAGLWDQPKVRADSVVENQAAADAQRYVATYTSTSTAMRVNVVEQGQEGVSAAAGTEG